MHIYNIIHIVRISDLKFDIKRDHINYLMMMTSQYGGGHSIDMIDH